MLKRQDIILQIYLGIYKGFIAVVTILGVAIILGII